MNRGAIAIIGFALVGCMCLAGCEVTNTDSPAGPVTTDTRTVAQGGAKSAAVEIDMNTGDLKLTGGAENLMDAEFRYNVPEWKPEVDYSVTATKGKLAVRQPQTRGQIFKRTRNQWDIRLRDVLPLDLKVRSDTGSSTMDLNGLALQSLTIESDTGDTTVDLGGRYADLKSVGIQGDTGQCTVDLTGDYPSLSNVRIEGDTGDIRADLTGHWKQSARVEIKNNTGTITVTLPSDIGVYVTTHKDTGRVSADGLTVQGDVYTNSEYGRSPITLNVNMSVDTGDINLRTARK